MRTTGLRGGRLALVHGVLALGACGEPSPPPPRTAETAAVEVVQLAMTGASAPRLLRPFGLSENDGMAPACLDALACLSHAERPEVLRSDELRDADHVAVDVEVRLPGDGSAVISMQLERGEDRSWKVHWLRGPGVECPPPHTRWGSGLSTSAPPGGD